MSPTVESFDPEKPNVVDVSLGVVSAPELDTLANWLPELKEELASRWPIKGIQTFRRNPHHPNQVEIQLAIALATSILKPLGEKLSAEVIEAWSRWKRRALPASPTGATPLPQDRRPTKGGETKNTGRKAHGDNEKSGRGHGRVVKSRAGRVATKLKSKPKKKRPQKRAVKR